MHVLSTTITEIAAQLASAKSNPTYWHGSAANAFDIALDQAVHDLISLANSLANH